MKTPTVPDPIDIESEPSVLLLATGAHFDALHDVILAKSLNCPRGLHSLEEQNLILYYGKGGLNDPVGRIDFLDANDQVLQRLADACDPASFGRNEEDVLDYTYRKAGKLDRTQFSVNFDPFASGLLPSIHDILLEGCDPDEHIRAELYKLNVYGPGSFFKPHKDTPRGTDMFASLVVVLPTKHKGGALTFRHDNHTYTFDSAHALAHAEKPSVAFAAFFSDVEHEVQQVESGYRVTLTYNLYRINDSPGDLGSLALEIHSAALEDTFRSCLSDPTFLPRGGLLGFGLRHEYPLNARKIPIHKYRQKLHEEPQPSTLDSIVNSLKGSDAVLSGVCRRLSLNSGLRVVYDDALDDGEHIFVMMKDRLDLRDHQESESLGIWLIETCHGQAVLDSRGVVRDPKKQIVVHWATPMQAEHVRREKSDFIAYGNEPWITCLYTSLCLIVAVGPPESRSTPSIDY